jgi:hypothetical protein
LNNVTTKQKLSVEMGQDQNQTIDTRARISSITPYLTQAGRSVD